MTSWIANELGYENIVNFTFSQTNSKDEIIARDIAKKLNHEWIFKSRDGGNFLLQSRKILDINFGLSATSGLSHGKSCYDLLNLDKFGVVHSGQIGDVVIGTFFEKKKRIDYKKGDGANSKKLIEKIANSPVSQNYDNQEIFKFYHRCFNSENQGN